MSHSSNSASNRARQARMWTSAVGVSTPSRSNSTARVAVRSGRSMLVTKPPGRWDAGSPRCVDLKASPGPQDVSAPAGAAGDLERLLGDLELLVRRHDEDR